MKLRIEIVDDLPEPEIVVRCGRVDDTIQKIQQFVTDQASGAPKLTFYKQNQEYYFPLTDVLFFETDGEYVYAHTAGDAYRIKYRLYELEEILPRVFMRASKSTIVNMNRIYSITHSLTSSSLVQFSDSHKQVYASRHYSGALRQRLNERSSYER